MAKGDASGHSGAMISPSSPVMMIPNAHNDGAKPGPRKKGTPLAKTVTTLVYPDGEPYRLISSGSFNGYDGPKSRFGLD